MRNFSLRNKTSRPVRNIPFGKIKEAVLGPSYDLSVALVSPAEARAVTRKTKHKDKPSNVLAFPLSNGSGEIVLCPAEARRQAPEFGLSARAFLANLFIHGMLHLKGLPHGVRMTRQENQILKKFGFRR